MKKSNQAFTLIELLVVIAIIGILATVVIASLTSARTKARDAKRMGDARAVQTALEMYYNDNGVYPASADVVFPGILASTIMPTYIASIPSDPGSSTYRYYTNNTTVGYAIRVNFETKPSCFYYGGTFGANGNYWGLPGCN